MKLECAAGFPATESGLEEPRGTIAACRDHQSPAAFGRRNELWDLPLVAK
jgi:hypothetical protein